MSVYTNIIVVDGLPVVGQDRCDKLIMVLKSKVFVQEKIVDIQMPFAENNQTLGFAFIEFENDEDAVSSLQKFQNLQLDKIHKLSLYPADELIETLIIDENFGQSNDGIRFANREWLLDPRGIDQYFVARRDKLELFWNTVDRKLSWSDPSQQNPELISESEKLAHCRYLWSSLGTYLVSIDKMRGVSIFTEPKLELRHLGVKEVMFSPKETFVVTLSENQKKIWALSSGQNVLEFKDEIETAIVWSFDDAYFALTKKDQILIYETKTMTLLNGKALKVPGVRSCSWSPGENILAYFIPAEKSRPGCITLLSLPSRKVLVSSSLLDVINVSYDWHTNGSVLAVKIDGTKYSRFEFFQLKEKGIPIERLSEFKQHVSAFAWEPNGYRLAIVIGQNDKNRQVSVVFYELTKNGIKKLITLNNRSANSIYWAPNDGNVVLVGGQKHERDLEFYNVEFKATMNTGSHLNANDFSWDPVGRFFVSTVTNCKTENGFHIWSFDGRLLQKIYVDTLSQFKWRPRPPSVLSKEDEIHLQQNLLAKVDRYRQHDVLVQEATQKEYLMKKRKTRAEFYKWYDQLKTQFEQDREKREKLLGSAYFGLR